MKWEMEMEEIEVLLERIWDIHDKLSDAIHAISRSHFLNSIKTLKKSEKLYFSVGDHNDEKKKPHCSDGEDGRCGFVFVKDLRIGDEEAVAEAKSLNAIRTALENFEDQLEFFHMSKYNTDGCSDAHTQWPLWQPVATLSGSESSHNYFASPTSSPHRQRSLSLERTWLFRNNFARNNPVPSSWQDLLLKLPGGRIQATTRESIPPLNLPPLKQCNQQSPTSPSVKQRSEPSEDESDSICSPWFYDVEDSIGHSAIQGRYRHYPELPNNDDGGESHADSNHDYFD